MDDHTTPGGVPDADRVRESTAAEVLHDIDEATAARIDACAAQGRDAIDRRLSELDGESDVERLLEINASILALGGLSLGVLADRRWLILPGVVLPFLLQHGVQGWCPPLPVMRRLGARTRAEIDAERVALKALRGDFEGLGHAGAGAARPRAADVLAAVRA
ncbi:hypothetical protein [Miltoncostaea marina]|uniref:hypothetical protein n=1 Tax=Miltoncostaea marina TaxID=2843215 RepID=UPI001C3E6461|nr:hypothetical protein [Miltoncostaea marina]